ncbi:23152_t:CDS:2, partial [Gigaspora rosea]
LEIPQLIPKYKSSSEENNEYQQTKNLWQIYEKLFGNKKKIVDKIYFDDWKNGLTYLQVAQLDMKSSFAKHLYIEVYDNNWWFRISIPDGVSHNSIPINANIIYCAAMLNVNTKNLYYSQCRLNQVDDSPLENTSEDPT